MGTCPPSLSCECTDLLDVLDLLLQCGALRVECVLGADAVDLVLGDGLRLAQDEGLVTRAIQPEEAAHEEEPAYTATASQ